MPEKMKEVGTHLSTLASDAVGGATSGVKMGAQSVADAATSAASSFSEKSVRLAVDQMRAMLQIAAEEPPGQDQRLGGYRLYCAGDRDPDEWRAVA
jgi:hypothetical protein